MLFRQWNRNPGGAGLRAVAQVLAVGSSLGGVAVGAPPELLTPAPATSVQGSADDRDPSVVRRRFVKVQPGLLSDAKTRGTGRLRMNLFEDQGFDITINTVVSKKSEQRYVLAGLVENEPHATVIVAVNGEATVADIRLPGGDTFQIRYRGNGVHEALHVVESQQPPCGVDADHEVEPAGTGADSPALLSPSSATLSPAIASDSGTMIDVMVVYTTQAKNQQGGISGIQALIDLAITYANNTYLNSKVGTSLRLVHTAEVAYTEAGDLGIDLSRLTTAGDGYMDNVHTLRDTYKADMVSLMVSTASGGTCGIAYVMRTLSSSFQSSCFSVVANTCVSNQSFTHELGHNMGCAHARGDGGTGLYSYSYGHRWTGNSGNNYRSVMAYSVSPGYSRIQYFSNPTVNYDGVPTGSPLGTGTEAYNALTINNSAYTIANFRASAPAAPQIQVLPTTLSAGATQGSTPASQTLQVGNSGGGTLTYSLSDNATWLSVTPTGGSSTGGLNTHTVTFNTATLSPGTHTAAITVTASGVSNSPLSVPVTVTVQPAAPVNDPYAGALPLTGSSGATAGDSTLCAANETGEPATVAGQPFGKSLWWKWTAPSNGTVTFDTFGSSFDTVLGVYRGTLGSLTPLAENDQSGGNQSRVGPLTVTGGTTYHVLVGGWYGESGAVKLNWAGSTIPVVLSGFSVE